MPQMREQEYPEMAATRHDAVVSDDLATVVRSLYLGRGQGVVDVSHSRGTESLFFRRGELHLDRDHAAAAEIAGLLVDLPEAGRPAASPGLQQKLVELARSLCRLRSTEIKVKDDRSMVVEFVGPLPTVCFLLELAIYGCDEQELIDRLGGENVRFKSTDLTPALEQLPGLDPEMAHTLVGLEQPATATELLRGAGSDRLKVVQGLAKLWAVGLAVPVEDPSREETGARSHAHDILTPKMLRTFLDRISGDLDADPLELPHEAHRVRLAELLSRLGQMSYYELLDIDLKADPQEVFNAYRELGRLVHPRNALRLGLEDKDEAVQLLFERATEAYLTLSDPKRRASYNTMAGIHVDVQIDAAQREQEKRNIARQNYRRAAICLAEMDYSLAIDLLKEAARIDPQPEYFARLAQAQSKNPNWQHHAVASYRRALELSPDNVSMLVHFGSLLEDMDRPDEARKQYSAAIDLMPDNIEAREGLERVGGLRSAEPKVKSTTGGFRSLFATTQGPGETSEEYQTSVSETSEEYETSESGTSGELGTSEENETSEENGTSGD